MDAKTLAEASRDDLRKRLEERLRAWAQEAGDPLANIVAAG